jgi:L-iditol 2-dehydrogenase
MSPLGLFFYFGGKKMKAVVIDEIGSFTLKDIDLQKPAAGEALVQVSVTGLCRTDLKIIRVGHRDLTLPRVPGEEVVGTIIELGENTEGYAEGQRVYVYPGTSCGECPQCKAGAENLCVKMQIMGFHRDGGFAEYVTAPVKSLIPLPESISNDEAVFAEPLSCCLNALELARPAKGESIGIWGGGPAGTLLKRVSEALGCRPFVIETDERRRKLADGFTVPPEKTIDIAVIAVGDMKAYRDAMQYLTPRGRLVVFSGLPKDNPSLSVDFNELHYREQTIVGAYGCSYRHGQIALDIIRDGQVRVSDMISHNMALDELDEALGIVERREGMKILLYP